jgi:hypothetical protein
VSDWVYGNLRRKEEDQHRGFGDRIIFPSRRWLTLTNLVEAVGPSHVICSCNGAKGVPGDGPKIEVDGMHMYYK